MEKVVELVVGGSVINGATPYILYICVKGSKNTGPLKQYNHNRKQICR